MSRLLYARLLSHSARGQGQNPTRRRKHRILGFGLNEVQRQPHVSLGRPKNLFPKHSAFLSPFLRYARFRLGHRKVFKIATTEFCVAKLRWKADHRRKRNSYGGRTPSDIFPATQVGFARTVSEQKPLSIVIHTVSHAPQACLRQLSQEQPRNLEISTHNHIEGQHNRD